MTETLGTTDLDVDLDATLPCEVEECDREAEWQWTFDCVLMHHQHLVCTPCKEAYQQGVKHAATVSCTAHSSPVINMKWRRL